MKLDLVALQNAVNAQLETLANQEAEDQEEAMQAAISAYCEKAGVVMVPTKVEALVDVAIRSFERNGMEHWKQCDQMKRIRKMIRASQKEE